MSTKTESAKKAKSGGKSKRKSSVAEHPKVSEMVPEAIANLKERNGSSLQAIKKYISSNFAVDVEKMAPFIRRYLKAQVTSGALVQTKGKGASGSFKLSGGGGSSVPSSPRKRPSAAVRAAAAAAPRPPKPVKAQKSPKSLAKEKTKRSPKKAKAPKPKKASARKGKKSGSTPKQETSA